MDSEKFVQVDPDGVRKYGELKKARALLFEFVYRELSGKNAKDEDTIDIRDAHALMRNSRASTTLDNYQQFVPESQRRVSGQAGELAGFFRSLEQLSPLPQDVPLSDA